MPPITFVTVIAGTEYGVQIGNILKIGRVCKLTKGWRADDGVIAKCGFTSREQAAQWLLPISNFPYERRTRRA